MDDCSVRNDSPLIKQPLAREQLRDCWLIYLLGTSETRPRARDGLGTQTWEGKDPMKWLSSAAAGVILFNVYTL